MDVSLVVPGGRSIRCEIENSVEIRHGDQRLNELKVCYADYVKRDQSLTYLQHGNTLEFVTAHPNRRRARIHASTIFNTCLGA